jgi:cytochrome c peroxidase
MTNRRSWIVVFALAAGACGSSAETPPPPATDPAAIPEPAPAEALGGLAALPTPQFDRREALLGRSLFHDTSLSVDGTISCATCHQLDHGGAEARRTSLGVHQQEGPINSPSVLNASLNFVQFWDGRAADLEAQAAGPMTNPLEMGNTFEVLLPAIRADAAYLAEFTAIYGAESPVTETTVTGAIAEYERMLVTPGRFDRFVGGDASALTEDERRGYALFVGVGCTSCHTGPNVGGTTYQRMGLVNDWFAQVGRPLTDADMGRFNVTHDEADRHRFKVPSLRNVALTAPYLHDGSQATLEAVVPIMGHYQLGRELTPEQVRLIVAFLGALTGELPADARPPVAPEVVPVPEGTPEQGIVPPPIPPSAPPAEGASGTGPTPVGPGASSEAAPPSLDDLLGRSLS